MIYATLKTVHVLSIIVWIGGMVFAHFFLRPALAQLEPPVRLRLMHDVLGRFFRAVLIAALLTLEAGLYGWLAWLLWQAPPGTVPLALAASWLVFTGLLCALSFHVWAVYRRAPALRWFQ